MKKIIILFTLLALCSCTLKQRKHHNLIIFDQEAYDRIQQGPIRFSEFKCHKEKVVGKWYYKFLDKPIQESKCLWNFKKDGSVTTEGMGCERFPDAYEIKRNYNKFLKAYLDITMYFNDLGMRAINADCTVDEEKLVIGEGIEKNGWTFYRVN